MYVVFCGQCMVVVNVDFGDFGVVLVGIGQFVQCWGDYFVGVILFGLEIDQYWFFGIQYCVIKVGVVDMYNFVVYFGFLFWIVFGYVGGG